MVRSADFICTYYYYRSGITCVTAAMRGRQKTASWSQFSPSTFMWVPGTESAGLGSKPLYPPSRLASPTLMTLFIYFWFCLSLIPLPLPECRDCVVRGHSGLSARLTVRMKPRPASALPTEPCPKAPIYIFFRQGLVCGLGWPGIPYVAQASFWLRANPLPGSWVLTLLKGSLYWMGNMAL